MSGKKVGSDGQIRNTTAYWAADTNTYPEGMRLMDTDTGSVRVSKGTTYALAWTAAAGSGSAWGDITGTLSAQTDLQAELDTKLEVADIAPTATFSTNTNTAQDPGQDSIRFNNATIGSVTEIALSDFVNGVNKGDLNSKFTGILQLRPVGATDTIEFQINSAVHTTWTLYTVTYLKGTLPANNTVCAVRFLPSNTVNAAVTTALAGKADTTLNGTIKSHVATVTGLVNANSQLVVDFSVASGSRPAFASVQFLNGAGDNLAGVPLIGYCVDPTPATFTVTFYNAIDVGPAAENDPVVFTVIGTP